MQIYCKVPKLTLVLGAPYFFNSTVLLKLTFERLSECPILALKKGEKPPDPTVPPPKVASELEIQNSVEVRAANITKDQVNKYFCIDWHARFRRLVVKELSWGF